SKESQDSLSHLYKINSGLAEEMQLNRRIRNFRSGYLNAHPVKANPEKFRAATLEEYREWLRAYLENGHQPTNFYDRPFSTSKMVTAIQDFCLRGSYGANSVEIIVPERVTYLGGEPGHCTVHLPG